MKLPRHAATHGPLVLVLLFCGLFAYVVAPFSGADKTVLVAKGDLDAIQQSLLVGGGMERLLTHPGSYYDTDILYPDHNQLRTTEPFLGFAVLGLPLRSVLRLGDTRVFEALRWLMLFLALCYSYFLYRTMGIDAPLAVAGAVLCVSQPDVLRGVDRLQVVAIPLVIPILFHYMGAWTSGRLGHSAALWLFVALYPLCGVINGTVSLMALLLMLPLLARVLTAQHRQQRLTACLLPIVLALVVDLLALAPWLLDRADLAVYQNDEFLQIKHWNPTPVPALLRDAPGFVLGRIGLPFAAAVSILAVFVARRYSARSAKDEGGPPGPALPTLRDLSPVLVSALVLLVITSRQPGSTAAAMSGLVFHVASYATLLLFWYRQVLLPLSTDGNGIARQGLLLGAGLGVFMCLLSFGPVDASNASPLASHVMRSVLRVLPPLSSIREFDRLWIFGILFLSMYVTIRLFVALRSSRPVVRQAVAAVILAAATWSVFERQLVATARVEAPRDFIEIAARSNSKGAMYVHPYMKWNSPSGVWMIAIARELGRPIVNGYLGISPPWFAYASSVLNRFPDAESLWLLRKWRVDTVVSLVGPVQIPDSGLVDVVAESGNGVVYAVAPPRGDEPHPSGGTCRASEGDVRMETDGSQLKRASDGASLTLSVSSGFLARAIEIHFRQSGVERIPPFVDVYAFEGGRRLRVNREHSGEWIESLAADALLHRQSPVATVRIDSPDSRIIDVRFRQSPAPPIERIVLCGQRTSATSTASMAGGAGSAAFSRLICHTTRKTAKATTRNSTTAFTNGPTFGVATPASFTSATAANVWGGGSLSVFVDQAEHGRWSPDARRLDDVSSRTGSRRIWVAERDGGNAVELPDPAVPEYCIGVLRWPDGRLAQPTPERRTCQTCDLATGRDELPRAGSPGG